MNKTITSAIALSLLLLPILPTYAQRGRIEKTKAPAEFVRADRITEVRAVSDGSGSWIRWDSDLETDERLFNVYRLGLNGSKSINATPIPRQVGGQGYFDRDGSLGSTYVLEAIGSSGNRKQIAQVSAEFVPDLSTEMGGRSVEQATASAQTSGTYASYQFAIPSDVLAGIDPGVKPTNPLVQRSVAAQPGVKIGIKNDGFFRVTRAQLSAAGFNVNSDETKWQLFLDGIQQSIIVEPAGSYIEFYAKAKELIESDTRYLFLINGTTAGRRMVTRVPSDTGAQIVASGYDQSFFLKGRTNYIYDIINGEDDNWWGSILSPTATNITFDLSGVDFTATNAIVTLKYQGFIGSNHSVTATLNGQTVGTATGVGAYPFGGQASIPTSMLINGENTLSLTGTAGSYPLFDSIQIDFKRTFNADQNRSNFYTLANRRSVVGNFSSANIRMFDVTYDGEPTQVTNLNITNNGGSFSVNYPAHRAKLYHAVEETGIQQVASIIPNLPSTLSTTAHNGRLVIITHGDFASQAEDWANYRRGQGISVEVVKIADVYDEFNYGQSTSKAITDFLRYARNSWQTPPEYVLLLGDASFDPKNYNGLGFQNLVPTKFVNTVYMETGSDEALADFNNDGLAELAVGRIPAKTGAHVTQSLNKTMAFEVPALQNMNRGVTCASDGPNGYDFERMCELLLSEFPSSVPKTYINRLSHNSALALINDVNVGRYMVNYSGHGTTGAWFNSSFFGVNNFNDSPGVSQVANGNNLTVFNMLTCLNGYFMNPYFDSLSEAMQKHNNGGSVANWASTGKTTPDVQLLMGLRFFDQVSVGNMTRIGDLIKDAKTVINGGTDVRLSWALIGDPMLKIRP